MSELWVLEARNKFLSLVNGFYADLPISFHWICLCEPAYIAKYEFKERDRIRNQVLQVLARDGY